MKRDKANDEEYKPWIYTSFQNPVSITLGYIFAFVFGPFRGFGLLFSLIASFVVSWILMIGADIRKPLPYWRTKAIEYVCYMGAVGSFTLGISVFSKTIKSEMDYEYYLGPNWRKELAERKKPIPTVLYNHASFIDPMYALCTKWRPSFAAKDEIKKSLVGKQAMAIQSLFLKRGKKSNEDPV